MGYLTTIIISIIIKLTLILLNDRYHLTFISKQRNETSTRLEALLVVVVVVVVVAVGDFCHLNKILSGNLFRLWENDDHGLPDHQDIRDHNLEAFFLATYRVPVYIPMVMFLLIADDERHTGHQ